MNLDIDTMSIEELKNVIKMLVRVNDDDHLRLSSLEDRVLELENRVSNQSCNPSWFPT